METLKFGRKTYAVSGGQVMLTSVTVTEKPKPGEDETAFTRRLTEKYKSQQCTIELVIKKGVPDYAIITRVNH